MCRTSVKAAVVLQPLLGITNILQIVSNPYDVSHNLILPSFNSFLQFFSQMSPTSHSGPLQLHFLPHFRGSLQLCSIVFVIKRYTNEMKRAL